jgi:hypothetical protein
MNDQSASGLSITTLVKAVKANVDRGDRDRKKSDDFYTAAGIHLIELKARLPVEEPGARWVTWTAQHFPQIGLSRIDQLIRIGNGSTTQAELNTASNAHRRAAGADTRQRASEQTGAQARDAERKRHERAKLDEIRVANGGKPSKPRKPITIEGTAIDLTPPTPAKLFADVLQHLDAMSIDDVGEFSKAVNDYMTSRSKAGDIDILHEAVAAERPEVNVTDAAPEPEPAVAQTERERKMALADSEVVGDALAAGGRMSQHSAARAAASEPPAPTILKPAGRKHGAVIRPDLAAAAAEIGLPVSAKAA